jgi:pyrimidine-nucleoside phosphorylase
MQNAPTTASLHTIDLIRKKRDGGSLDAREIAFLVSGAAQGSIPPEQLSAWLMAAYLNGLSLDETRSLTLAMRDSGEKFSPARLGKAAVDKHSTGGVGDKTSFLVAPIAAACGLAVPMISGRALGHTGGTLDKLESIPGYRTALTLSEFETVLAKCGASIVSQTPALVPADRVLYALRDRTGTVESPGLICASILSKKLAEGLNALVLDVKTGSGAFLRKREDAETLAALMVSTAEAAGTRTVALLTDMDVPLGQAAGNWLEVAECVEVLRGRKGPSIRDLRELSLILAGWMIHLGGQAESPEAGYARAEIALKDGSAYKVFLNMVEAQGGDISVFDGIERNGTEIENYQEIGPLFHDYVHKAAFSAHIQAWDGGWVEVLDTSAIGWAVQRTGAGREKSGERVDPHAGIVLEYKNGDFVFAGEDFIHIYASSQAQLDEAKEILLPAIRIHGADDEDCDKKSPIARKPLVSQIFTRENAESHLRNAIR